MKATRYVCVWWWHEVKHVETYTPEKAPEVFFFIAVHKKSGERKMVIGATDSTLTLGLRQEEIDTHLADCVERHGKLTDAGKKYITDRLKKARSK